MKVSVVKRFALGLFVFSVLSSTGWAGGMDMDKGSDNKADTMNMTTQGGSVNDGKTDGIKVVLSFKDDKAKTGDNDLTITVLDVQGKPITDASVAAAVEMDKMDKSMNMDMKDSKPITVDFKGGDDRGRYMGSVNFTDRGKWIVRTAIKARGMEKNIDFNIDVADAGPNWRIIEVFAGLVVLIICLAAMKKKKAAKS